ncbi:hypothetical protein RB195_025850 [Necator americanus]|uniref:Core-2/I-Branching enzyme n=1 Tax=Necator americanus TaxID=51031 RepID=A0ABR1EUD0_NECAM
MEPAREKKHPHFPVTARKPSVTVPLWEIRVKMSDEPPESYGQVFCSGRQPFHEDRCLVCQVEKIHNNSAFTLTEYGRLLYARKVKSSCLPGEKPFSSYSPYLPEGETIQPYYSFLPAEPVRIPETVEKLNEPRNDFNEIHHGFSKKKMGKKFRVSWRWLTIYKKVVKQKLKKTTKKRSLIERVGGNVHKKLIVNIFLKIDECSCIDSSGRLHDFCYRSIGNSSVRGRKFSCDHLEHLRHLGLLDIFSSTNISDDLNPVFITAFSQSHFMEGKRMVASIRAFYKTANIVVYDIGLSKKGVVRVKRWCHVEYRRFNFEDYPSYFRQLHTFRWKPIVIAEALRDFGVIWYMDTSVIVRKGDLRHIYALLKCRQKPRISFPVPSVEERDTREIQRRITPPWDTIQWTANLQECMKSTYLLHSFTGHGIYAATDPSLYSYFPVFFEELRKPKAKMYEAGLVLAMRTRETMEKIVKWSVLCALEENCMGTRIIPNTCEFTNGDRYSSFAHCHRYDQSVVNVLLADAYYYDRHYYTSEITDFFQIQRFISRSVKNRELRCI